MVGTLPLERKAPVEKITEKQRRLWDALNAFVMANGGWITSHPAHRWITIECKKDSAIPALLATAGYDPRHVGSHLRIDAGKFLQVDEIEIILPGK